MKRWLLRAAILSILSGSMLVAPARAGSVTKVITTEVLASPVTVKELDVTYTTDAEPFTNLQSIFLIPVSSTPSLSSSGATVKETFSPNINAATGLATQFSFTVPLDLATAESKIKITGVYFVTTTGAHVDPTSSTLSFAAGTVPEPGTLVLSGMAGVCLTAVLLRRRRRRLA